MPDKFGFKIVASPPGLECRYEITSTSEFAMLSHSSISKNLQLTAYELFDDKLKARSSTLNPLLLLFKVSFEARKPSKPCMTSSSDLMHAFRW